MQLAAQRQGDSRTRGRIVTDVAVGTNAKTTQELHVSCGFVGRAGLREAEHSHAHQHEAQLSATLDDRKKSNACERQQRAAKRHDRVGLIGGEGEHAGAQASEPQGDGSSAAFGLHQMVSVLLVEAKKAFLCVA